MSMLTIKTHSFLKVPFYMQKTGFTCWPASARMVLDFWEDNISFPEKQLAEELKTTSKDWTDNRHIINFFISSGYYVYNNKNSSLDDLLFFVWLWIPVVVNYKDIIWDYGHYGVVVGFTPVSLILNDPYRWELFKISKETFKKQWISWSGKNVRWMTAVIKEKYFPYYMLGKYQKDFICKLS